MHTILEVAQPAAEVAAAAAERGVAVATLDRYFAGTVTRNGLVLGYGGAALADVARGCDAPAGPWPLPDATRSLFRPGAFVVEPGADDDQRRWSLA